MKSLVSMLMVLTGAALVALALACSGCCKEKPPVYLPAQPVLTDAPPPRPDISRVPATSPDVYMCFSREGAWDLVTYLNAVRLYAEDAWIKCGPAPVEKEEEKPNETRPE